MPPLSKGDIDIIATTILFDAQSALTNLKSFDKHVTNSAQRIAELKRIISEVARQSGGDLKKAEAAVKSFANSLTGIKSAEVAQAGKELRQLGDRASEAGTRTKGAFEQAVTGVNAFRIALGAVISMLLFQAIQAVSQFFGEASKQARQLEDTLYRLGNVERSLSLEGIEISLEGLEEGITRIQKKLPIFSREDVSQLVGTLAISTKQLGLTEQQILDLAQAVAVLNVRSEKQEDLSTTAQHVLSSLLTGNARGITSLGIAFTDNVMRAKAMELGFLRANEALSSLSENEKGITKLNIVLESTGQELNSVNDYLETNTAKIQANKSAWQDLLTTIGQTINNLIPNLVPLFEKIQEALEVGKIQNLFTGEVGGIKNIFSGQQEFGDTAIIYKLYTGVKLTVDEYERLKTVLSGIDQKEILKIFPDPSAIKDRFVRELVQSLVDLGDTATNTAGQMTDFAQANAATEEAVQKTNEIVKKYQEDLQDIMQESADKRADIERAYGQKLQDIARDYSQKLTDLATDTARKREDALRDYNQKVQDINLDAQQKTEEAIQEAHDKVIKLEEEYQQKLKELRQKFLFDLEDALRERDARQVLRLVRQYKLDKQNLEDKYKLDQQQAKIDLQLKLQAIEKERVEKLAAAQLEYQQKLQDIQIAEQREREEIALWHQRQLEDARLAHQRQLAEQREYLQRKLRDLAAALAAELGITQQAASAMLQTLQGLGSAAGSVFAGLASQIQGSINGIIAQVQGSGAVTLWNGGDWGGYTPGNINNIPGYARGGSVVADKPTLAMFGERGAEMATFTPLTGGNRNMDSERSGGSLALSIQLSDGLIAEIVDTSLDNVAVALERVSRSKR